MRVKYDFAADFPALTPQESEAVRDKFYADWLRNMGLQPKSYFAFRELVAEMESEVGDLLSYQDDYTEDDTDGESTT